MEEVVKSCMIGWDVQNVENRNSGIRDNIKDVVDADISIQIRKD